MTRIIADPGQYWAQGASIGLQLGEQERRAQQFQQASEAQALREAEDARRFDLNLGQQRLEFDTRAGQWDRGFGLDQQEFRLRSDQQSRINETLQRQVAERQGYTKVLAGLTREKAAAARGAGMSINGPFSSAGASFQEPVTGAMVGGMGNDKISQLIDAAERAGSPEALEAIFEHTQDAESLQRFEATMRWLEQNGIKEGQAKDPRMKALISVLRINKDPKQAATAVMQEMQAQAQQAAAQQAAVAEQEARARGLATIPGEVGNRARVVFGATGEAPTGTALFNALEPAGTGQGMLTPFQRLQQIEDEIKGLNAQTNPKTWMMSPGLLMPPSDHDVAAAAMAEGQVYNPPGWNNEYTPEQMAVARARVSKWKEYEAARAAVLGGGFTPPAMSAGGQAPGLVGPIGNVSVGMQADPAMDAAIVASFTQRFGLAPDPSNPKHLDALDQIEQQLNAQQQGQR